MRKPGVSYEGRLELFSKTEKILYICCFLLAIIAYLTHLGFIPLNVDTDEGRRALVTAEMMISGDYLTPTLNGEVYLLKPPLYNWIVAGYFTLFSDNSMFIFRLPVIVACAGVTLTIYLFVKKYTDRRIAFFTAIAFLTNGRILIYDSLLGLIDTTFSWIVYLTFMLIFYFGQQKKYYALFIISYLLASLGFLLKGLPAIVFEGITLLVYFILTKNFRKFFHPAHFIGAGIFLLITGTYYYLLSVSNDLSLRIIIMTLLNESTQRTIIRFNFLQTLTHILAFPFEFLYHFAPWTIFIIVLFQKRMWQSVRKNDFIHYTIWIFLANILIYWFSPQVYARYLLMFPPLLYSVLFYFFFINLKETGWQKKTINLIITIITLIFWAICFLIPFIKETQSISYLHIKTLFLLITLGITVFIVLKRPAYRLYAFVLVVIIFRIEFNWLVLEQRGKKYFEAKKVSQQIVEITKSDKLFLLPQAKLGNFDGMSFYISTQRGEVLRYNPVIQKNAFYIADEHQLDSLSGYTEYLSFNNYLSDSLKLVKF